MDGILRAVVIGLLVSTSLAKDHVSLAPQHGLPASRGELVRVDAASVGSTVRVQTAAGGIQQVIDETIPPILDQLRGSVLPGAGDRDNGFEWELKNIKIDDISIANVVATFPGYIRLAISNLNIDLSCEYKYKNRKFPYLPRGSGRASVEIRNGNVDMGIVLSSDGEGNPLAAVKHAQVTLGKVKVRVRSGLFRWLVNLIIKIFDGRIRRTVQSSVAEVLDTSIGGALQDALEAWVPQRAIDKWAVLYYGFGPVSFPQNKNLQINVGAEFLSLSDPAHRYRGPRAVLPSRTDNQHIELFLDQFVLNSASHVYFHEGRLQGAFDADTVGADFPIPLRTDQWKQLLPQLPQRFPGRKMQLSIRATRAPLVEMSRAAGASIEAELEYSFSVAGPDGGSYDEHAFTLSSSLGASLQIWVEDDQNFHFRLANPVFDLAVVRSDIGDIRITVGLVELLGKTLLENVLIPLVNDAVKDGFPMPGIPGFLWKRTKISFEDAGVLDVRGDLELDRGFLALVVDKWAARAVEESVDALRVGLRSEISDE